MEAIKLFMNENKSYVQILADVIDEKGRKAINLCGLKIKKIFESHLLYLKRYKIDDVVVHRSATCVRIFLFCFYSSYYVVLTKFTHIRITNQQEVVFAIDVLNKTPRYPDGKRICLKLMKHREQFEKEIRCRSEHGEVNDIVISVLGYHLPKDEPDLMKNSFSHLLQEERTGIENSSYNYILVMNRAENSAFHVVLTQRIAGIDAEDCAMFSRNIAQQISKLHHAGLVHCDIKLRNILVMKSRLTSMKERNVILCDLDCASAMDGIRTGAEKIGSSAYYAPEMARFVTSIENMKAMKQNSNTPILKCTAALDVWSFGVVLYELCSGVNLFAQVG